MHAVAGGTMHCEKHQQARVTNRDVLLGFASRLTENTREARRCMRDVRGAMLHDAHTCTASTAREGQCCMMHTPAPPARPGRGNAA
jgi:hypothetical protein